MKNNIGGRLQGISLDAFLQMAQMEQITCTLSVASRGRKGLLFLKEGSLISAETEELSPLDAAQRIISWEHTVIEITESCSKTTDEIRQPLMNLLMAAMKIRDDAEDEPDPEMPEIEDLSAPEGAGTIEGSAATPEKESAPPPGETPAGRPEPQTDTETKTPLSLPVSPKDLPWKYIIAGAAIVIVCGSLALFFLSKAKKTRLAFESLTQTVEATEGRSEKLALLNTYLREHQGGKYTPTVKQMVEGLLAQKAASQFGETEKTATRLAAGGDISGAMAAYETFIEANGKGSYREKAVQALESLSAQSADRAFDEMKRTAAALGPERLSTYQAFLERYPDSPHREEVLMLVSDMEAEYYLFLKRRHTEDKAPDDLEQTLQLSRQFIDTYPESSHIEEINRLLASGREEFQAAMSFTQLRNRADALGEDYDAARSLFEDYLKAYPGSPSKEKIGQEINRLTALIEGERISEAISETVQALSEAGSRFKIENDETVLDTWTGLMWCLIDSRTATNRCLSYDRATEYVASLETGSVDDWRLPTSEELSKLYARRPSFPSDSERWYWSSETEKRYIDQWRIEVKVFHPDHPEGQEIRKTESWQCGTVRAVRRP